MKKNTKLYFLYFLSFVQIIYCSDYFSFSSSITLKIKGPGNSMLYSQSSVYPDEVIVNGNNTSLIYAKCYLDKEENVVNLKWNYPINNIKFQRCINITEIDFSNFYSKNFTNMSNMFRDCSLLKSINFFKFIILFWN